MNVAYKCLALLALLPGYASAFEGGSKYEESLTSAIDHFEQRLAIHRKLLVRRATSASSIDKLEAQLVLLRCDLAASKADKASLLVQTRELLEIRQRQQQRLLQLSQKGQKFVPKLLDMERRLHIIGHLIANLEDNQPLAVDQLARAAQICQEEVQWWEEAASKRLSSRVIVNQIRNRLVCAEYRLLKEDPESAVSKLRSQVGQLQGDWSAIKRLQENGGALYVHVYFAQVSLINAKLRLGNASGQLDETEAQLQQLIDLHSQVLERGQRANWNSYFTDALKQNLELAILNNLAYDQRRLRNFQRTKKITDDLTLAELAP